MLLVLLISAVIIAILFGRKEARGFLDSALTTIGLCIVVLFGLGIALYVTDRRQAAEQRQVRPLLPVASSAPSNPPLTPNFLPKDPPTNDPIRPTQKEERLFREVDGDLKRGKLPKSEKEWNDALAPYAGQ